MKVFTRFGLVAVVVLRIAVMASQANALTVLDLAGEKVVYDDVNNQYWFWDLSAFRNRTFTEQLLAIENLNTTAYFGVQGWHMATFEEIKQTLFTNTEEAIATRFNPSRETANDIRWYGHYDRPDPTVAQPSHYAATIQFVKSSNSYLRNANVTILLDSKRYGFYGVWVVTNAPSYVIPEPLILLLLGAGLFGLVGLRWKLKK